MFTRKKINELKNRVEILEKERSYFLEMQYEQESINNDINSVKEDSQAAAKCLSNYNRDLEHKLNGYQRYKLIDAISKSAEISMTMLCDYYAGFDGNERVILLFSLFNNDKSLKFIEKLIRSSFVFTNYELNMLASAILQFKWYSLIPVLEEKYSIPNNIMDVLNAKVVLKKLTEGN